MDDPASPDTDDAAVLAAYAERQRIKKKQEDDNDKVMVLIIASLQETDAQATDLMNAAYDVFAYLCRKYERKTIVERFDIAGQLYAMRWHPGDTVETYLEKVAMIEMKGKALGCPFPADDILMCSINGIKHTPLYTPDVAGILEKLEQEQREVDEMDVAAFDEWIAKLHR